MVFKRTVVRSNLHRAICHSFILFIVAAFGRIDSLPTRPQLHDLFSEFLPKSYPSGAFFSLRCLIYKVHAVSGGTLLFYQTSSRLSRTFFKVFDVRSAQYRSNFFSLTRTSQLVKYFFQSFLTNFSVVLAADASAPTALLEYHPTPHLSTLFLHLFSLF